MKRDMAAVAEYYAKLKKNVGLAKTLKTIRTSGLFDESWYRNANRDVGASAIDGARHYVHFGAKEGRDPHPLFDTDWYAHRYSKVVPSGLNPLIHYLKVGNRLKLSPNPLFDPEWYMKESQGRIDGNLLEHYLRDGSLRGLDPHPLFDTDWYLGHHHDVRDSGLNALQLFRAAGGKEEDLTLFSMVHGTYRATEMLRRQA
jgi:hypothetical protein